MYGDNRSRNSRSSFFLKNQVEIRKRNSLLLVLSNSMWWKECCEGGKYFLVNVCGTAAACRSRRPRRWLSLSTFERNLFNSPLSPSKESEQPRWRQTTGGGNKCSDFNHVPLHTNKTIELSRLFHSLEHTDAVLEHFFFLPGVHEKIIVEREREREIVDVQPRVTPQHRSISIVIGNAHVDYPKSFPTGWG